MFFLSCLIPRTPSRLFLSGTVFSFGFVNILRIFESYYSSSVIGERSGDLALQCGTDPSLQPPIRLEIRVIKPVHEEI